MFTRERLVAELPTATVPRKELIARYVREGRWNEVGRHLHEHEAIAPSDRGFIETTRRRRPPDRDGD